MNLENHEEEKQAVKEVIAALTIATRIHALYPEDHSIFEKAVNHLWTQLQGFLENCGDLTLEVKKDGLLYHDEVVHQEQAADGHLPFALFRDGIQKLVFQRNLELKEVVGFTRFIDRYKSQSEAVDGDLVTALWEAQFPNIQYEAVDVLWDAEPIDVFDLSSSSGERSEGSNEKTQRESLAPPKVSHHASTDSTVFELSQEEEAELHEMVLDGETREPTEDVLDMLVDALQAQDDEEDFTTILEFLEEELQDSLLRCDFAVAHKILRGLQFLHPLCENEKPWALPHLEDFFVSAASPQTLWALQDAWAHVEPGQIAEIKKMLLLLRPEATYTLGPMWHQVTSAKLKRMLLEVIITLAAQNLRPLEALMEKSEGDLKRAIIYIVGQLDGERPTQILLKMVHHPSEEVRREAIKALLIRGPWVLKKLFPLIEDSGESVSRMILEYLGWRKSEVAEGLLLDYLKRRKFRRTEDSYRLACFKALGKCGSDRSIPFLRQTLLNRGWMPGFWKSIPRKEAAVALMVLGTERGKEILEEASRSPFPSVRSAIRKAMVEAGRPRMAS